MIAASIAQNAMVISHIAIMVLRADLRSRWRRLFSSITASRNVVVVSLLLSIGFIIPISWR